MNKAVTDFQPIESDAGPGCQGVLAEVVVLDFDSVSKRLLAPAKCAYQIWEK